jgi:hypothetical protein
MTRSAENLCKEEMGERVLEEKEREISEEVGKGRIPAVNS